MPELAECGTDAAYKRHRYRGEEPDEDCRAAHSTYNVELQRKNAEPRPSVRCGTDTGYRRHLRLGEETCPDCRAAHSAAVKASKERQGDHAKCGTRAGYYQHLNAHETVCDPCFLANSEWNRAQQRTAEPPVIAASTDDEAEVHWRMRGACVGVPDPDIFFPHPTASGAAAVAICERCPVRRECLEAALLVSDYHDHGVLGGLTERQRRNLRRRRAKASR